MLDTLQGIGMRQSDVGAAGTTAATRIAGARGSQAVATENEVDFASLIGEAVAGLAQSLRAAETVSVAGIKGQASLQDVVETVMTAEQTLQAAVAVRDKVVSAYLEISRMSI